LPTTLLVLFFFNWPSIWWAEICGGGGDLGKNNGVLAGVDGLAVEMEWMIILSLQVGCSLLNYIPDCCGLASS
jgi:hypothetical protein